MMDGPRYLEFLKATKSGNVQKLQQLINDQEANILGITTQEGNNTALHMASRFGHTNLVEEIIKNRPSLTFKINQKGETPVHVASRAGKLNVVEYFITAMQDYKSIHIGRMRDKFGNTPLHGSVRNAHFRVMVALAENDPQSLRGINDVGESPLSIAIDMRLTDFADKIIDLNKETLTDVGLHDQTPLHVAVKRKNFEIMSKIVALKPELVKNQDDRKRTPLHYAAALGHQKMVEELFNKNPMVAYEKDNNGKVPLHLAAETGQVSLVKHLLASCWDTVEMVDEKQRNILHLAAIKGNVDVVKYILTLVQMEDLVNSPDVDGNTPLHLAAANYHSDVVMVLSNKCNVEIRAVNKSNRTALAIVKFSTHDRGMELQKHLTLKALKSAYKLKFISPEDILGDPRLDYEKVEIPADYGEKGRQMAQMIAVMSTLIATFTFTAAFTIPGGYKNDDPDAGMATLTTKTAFQAFVISDSVAMTSSITAAVIVFWSSARRDAESFMDTLPFAIGLTWISLIAMAVAFVTGLFVVLRKRIWLAILVCVTGCAAPFFLYIFAPILLLVFEKVSKSRTSPTERQNMVEDNPFLFIVRLLKILFQRHVRFIGFKCKSVCILLQRQVRYIGFKCQSLCRSQEGRRSAASAS